MVRKLVRLTNKHIKRGRENKATHVVGSEVPFMAKCPVALAIADAYGKSEGSFWTSGHCYGHIDGAKYYADLPRSAKRFVAKFDNDEPVKPFNFYVETLD